MCEHHQRNAFNPFENGEKNGAKTLRVNQALGIPICCSHRVATKIKNIRFHSRIRKWTLLSGTYFSFDSDKRGVSKRRWKHIQDW